MTYIIGPKSASEHVHPLYDKHIYIFGDYHVRQFQPCGKRQPQIPIHKWIHQLGLKQKVDLFLEIPEYETGYRPLFEEVKQLLNIEHTRRLESYLQDTIHYFKVKIPNIQVHFTDLRESCLGFPKDISKTNAICMFRDLLDALSLIIFSKGYNRTQILKKWLTIPIVQQTIHALSSKSVQGIHADLLRFEHYCKIEKHIQNIKNSKLEKFFKTKLIQARKNTEIIFKKLLIRLKQVRNITDVQNLIIDFYGDFLIEYMDLWILVQIFEHSEYRHNVIYVGHIHADQYRRDLKKLGFDVLQSTKSKNEVSCIQMK